MALEQLKSDTIREIDMAKCDPLNGDQTDLRCAFIASHPGHHDQVTEDDWCPGCGFYVCETCCQSADVPFGRHGVAEHREESED